MAASPEHPAVAAAHEPTGDETLSRARTLRELGEKFDRVITQAEAEKRTPPPEEWVRAAPFVPRRQQQPPEQWVLAEPFYPRRQPPPPPKPSDPWLVSLREHFELSPRFYDTSERCVSVKELGRMQHDLVAEYHERPQLWMSPHLLADVRKKLGAGKRSKKKW